LEEEEVLEEVVVSYSCSVESIKQNNHIILTFSLSPSALQFLVLLVALETICPSIPEDPALTLRKRKGGGSLKLVRGRRRPGRGWLGRRSMRRGRGRPVAVRVVKLLASMILLLLLFPAMEAGQGPAAHLLHPLCRPVVFLLAFLLESVVEIKSAVMVMAPP
jgi:hypothetical protein